jgi:hypothetical protein
MTHDSHELWLRGTAWVRRSLRATSTPSRETVTGKPIDSTNKPSLARLRLFYSTLSLSGQAVESGLKDIESPLRKGSLERIVLEGCLAGGVSSAPIMVRPAQITARFEKFHFEQSRGPCSCEHAARTRQRPPPPRYPLRCTAHHARCIYPF